MYTVESITDRLRIYGRWAKLVSLEGYEFRLLYKRKFVIKWWFDNDYIDDSVNPTYRIVCELQRDIQLVEIFLDGNKERIIWT